MKTRHQTNYGFIFILAIAGLVIATARTPKIPKIQTLTDVTNTAPAKDARDDSHRRGGGRRDDGELISDLFSHWLAAVFPIVIL